MGRTLYLILGLISLALGIVGVVLPILPTTPFLLVSAFCFSKAHPRLHAWLLNHPLFGPPILDWQKHRVIRPRVKILSITMIAVGIGTLWWAADSLESSTHLLVWKIILTLIMVSVSVFIATRNSRPATDNPPRH